LFVCLQNVNKRETLKTKACTLIWDTNPRSPSSFGSIGLCTAEKFQFSSVTDRQTTTDYRHMNYKRQVKLWTKTVTDYLSFGVYNLCLNRIFDEIFIISFETYMSISQYKASEAGEDGCRLQAAATPKTAIRPLQGWLPERHRGVGHGGP
jgi:hypothetical protein